MCGGSSMPIAVEDRLAGQQERQAEGDVVDRGDEEEPAPGRGHRIGRSSVLMPMLPPPAAAARRRRRCPEPLLAGAPLVLGVEPPGELEEAAPGAPRPSCPAWLEVDVEQAAALPGAVLEEPALSAQPLVQRRARERRHDGDLDVELPALADERLDGVEDLGSVAVEPEDEAAVDGDPVRLDPADVRPGSRRSGTASSSGAARRRRCRPALGLSSPMRSSRQPDSRIRSSSSGSSAIEMSDSLNQRIRSGASAAQQLLGMAAIDEAVVVGELDERVWPESLDLPDLGQHLRRPASPCTWASAGWTTRRTRSATGSRAASGRSGGCSARCRAGRTGASARRRGRTRALRRRRPGEAGPSAGRRAPPASRSRLHPITTASACSSASSGSAVTWSPPRTTVTPAARKRSASS